MNPPVVSIVIPTYNRCGLLARAIESVRAQTFTNWEIVLVDDGSTDDTPRVAADYAARLGDRLHYVQQANAGSSAARNRGIDVARGEFVCFLDADDEFLPRKLERQVALFERRRELGFVYSDFAYVTYDGHRHPSVWADLCRQGFRVPREEIEPGLCICTGDLFDTLLQEYFIATIVGMVRRGVLGAELRFPAGCAYAEEWLFYLKVARACRCGFVNEPLSLHHHVEGSLARTDRHRNTQRLHDLLVSMPTELAPLSPRHHRTIRRKLADTSRQLGYDLYHGGHYRAAAERFAESCRHRPAIAPALHWLDARVRSLFCRALPPAAQEPARPVR
ncbi:MAG TPA: glycosyltransferase family A protein [Phycisphaerae bacterium]|nr:glycosyltransferase family A protein [Phycisphaerae bacterium]HNU45909.1 glycosyltransferase family A protein [Phycisphaerae bacterium]